MVLQTKVIEEDISKAPGQRKLVSAIVCPNNQYVKASCEGYLNSDGDLCLKISGICEDPDVTIHEEELRNDVLFGICKVIFVKGVVPLSTPL